MKKKCWTLVVKTRLLWFYLAWFPYDHYHRCDRCDRWAKQSSSIVAITEWSYGNHFLAIPAIAATTIAAIELFLSQRSLSLRKWFPHDRYHCCDRWTFIFLSDRSNHSDGKDHMHFAAPLSLVFIWSLRSLRSLWSLRSLTLFLFQRSQRS